MSTYDYIDTAVLQPLLYVGYLPGCPEPAHIIDIARKILQPTLERVVMLQGKYCSRDQHGHLLAVGHSLECGTYSHLRLAEPHITADQPVHRIVCFHVSLHGLYGLFLVRSIFIHER